MALSAYSKVSGQTGPNPPIKRLRAFERVALDPGETKKVSFELRNEDFSYWDDSKKDWSIEAGEFEIMIGSSSEEIRLKASLTLD